MADAKQRSVEFTTSLETLLGDRLHSVVLHGSVARGEAVPGVSNVNLMILVDHADPGLLRTLAPRAREWGEAERALPLVLTRDEWRGATDAFAIETADMLDAREVLSGEDPIEGLVVDREHLRLQAERELRVKLIHLREGTLAAADRPRDLGRLLMAALPSVATYLRAALRLGGRTVPGSTPDVLREGGALVGAPAAELDRLWALRTENRTPRLEVSDPLVAAAHQVLERTVEYVDKLPGERTA